MVDVVTPRKAPSSAIASGPDAAIALGVAIAIRTQATAAAHNSRDDQFCFTVFSTEIMTLSFRGSDFSFALRLGVGRPRSLPGGG
jgi:hypothetical protein